MREILIYDKGESKGSVTINTPMKEGVLTEIIDVRYADNADAVLYVLHVVGMDYGIIVPDEMAKKYLEVYDL